MSNNNNKKNLPEEDDVLKRAREKKEKKDSKKAAKQALIQKKLDTFGTYISKREETELNAMQKKKTIFMYLSTLFYAVYLFMPVAANVKLVSIPTGYAIYLLTNFIGIFLSIYVSFHSFKRIRIKKVVSEMVAPRGGFNKRTYTSFELFNLYHCAIALAQIGLTIWVFDIYGLLASVLLVASAAASFIARMILFKANLDSMDYIPAVSPLHAAKRVEDVEEDKKEETGIVEGEIAINEETEKNENAAALNEKEPNDGSAE